MAGKKGAFGVRLTKDNVVRISCIKQLPCKKSFHALDATLCRFIAMLTYVKRVLRCHPNQGRFYGEKAIS